MRLTWLIKDFICKELYAPFIIENDNDYYDDLRNKFNIVLNQAKKAKADSKSIDIIQKYKSKILDALRCYYNADLSKCNAIIKKLVSDVGDNSFAVERLSKSYAFPGNKNKELQLFRCRLGNPSKEYKSKDMLHLPLNMRSKTGNYRFSIPGNPSLYLSNSSYGCWIETGFPSEIEFNVAPVVLDGEQRVFNLAVSVRNIMYLNELEENRVHCWLKLIMLMIATSYRIKEEGRTFKSEYVISQAIMMACKKLGYDGVAYYSKRVTDEIFSFCAINLALFVKYDKTYSTIVKHMKMDDAFNYAIFKQLQPSLKYRDYELRSVQTGLITNIGNYNRQYPYRETEFFDFDKFLFSTWTEKPNKMDKGSVPWGIDTN